MKRKTPSLLLAIIWSALLGLTGFVTAVATPTLMLSDPGAQTPLGAIFVFLPLGIVIGLFLGFLPLFNRLSAVWRFVAVTTSIVVFAGSIVLLGVFSFTDIQGRLVDARVIACERPTARLEERMTYWQKWAEDMLVREPSVVRRDWKTNIERVIKSSHGVILKVRIDREAEVMKQEWRSGGASYRIREWNNVGRQQQVFFVSPDGSCESIILDKNHICYLSWHRPKFLPPIELSYFLMLPVLQERVPDYMKQD